MRRPAVIDAGPLIAFFDKDDAFHESAIAFLKGYRGKLYSTLAIVTEVTHLLDFSVNVQLDFLRWLSKGAVTLIEIDVDDIEAICTLTEKYSNVPMDFADASLVLIADRLEPVPKTLIFAVWGRDRIFKQGFSFMECGFTLDL